MSGARSSADLIERYPQGFPQFFDEVAEPLLRGRCGMELNYAMVSPVESPHDTPYMNAVRDRRAVPSTVIGEQYLTLLDRIRRLGGCTTRLVVVPGLLERLPASELALTRAMYQTAHEEGGETFRLASFVEQVPRLYAASGEHTHLADAYVDGVRKRSPDGGYWAVYEASDSPSPLVVATVAYEQGVFTGFDVHRREPHTMEGQQPITPELETYVQFWRSVFLDTEQSTAILPA